METKKLLFQSAKTLLLNEGVGSLTVEKICAEAGVSKGGFFHHFQNRDAFLKALLSDLTEENQQQFQKFLQTDDLAFGKGLRAYICSMLVLSSEAKQDAKAICRCLIEMLTAKINLSESFGASDGYYQHLINAGTESGMSHEQALLILLATEGLWYDQSLGMGGIPSKQVASIVEFLVELTKKSIPLGVRCQCI